MALESVGAKSQGVCVSVSIMVSVFDTEHESRTVVRQVVSESGKRIKTDSA